MQIVGFDDISGAERGRPFEYVLEFADIAGKRILLQGLDRFGAQPGRRVTEQARKHGCDQWCDVLDPFTQRRHA